MQFCHTINLLLSTVVRITVEEQTGFGGQQEGAGSWDGGEGEATMGGRWDWQRHSLPHPQPSMSGLEVQHRTCKITGRDWSSPIARPTAFLRGSGSKLPSLEETPVAPMGSNGAHFGTVVPMGDQPRRIGLLVYKWK